ncbi:hypothetical protein [Martelella mangrovi]|uniref:Transcriptional regulator n=1 Tax=Martelella mangrovi TaxID=1397477 RepID=A0ABV2IDN9_9HYPH
MEISPLAIVIVMNIYKYPNPIERVGEDVWKSQAGMDCIQGFLSSGIIKSGEDGRLRVTEKGRVWITRILATPFPTYSWSFPDD